MTPDKVLDAVYAQLYPLILELRKYNESPNDIIKMEFEVGIVTFEFK